MFGVFGWLVVLFFFLCPLIRLLWKCGYWYLKGSCRSVSQRHCTLLEYSVILLWLQFFWSDVSVLPWHFSVLASMHWSDVSPAPWWHRKHSQMFEKIIQPHLSTCQLCLIVVSICFSFYNSQTSKDYFYKLKLFGIF